MPTSNSEARKRREERDSDGTYWVLDNMPHHRVLDFDQAVGVQEVSSAPDRTTWGSEHEDLDVLRAELAACRAEIRRLRARLAHPARFRRVPRADGFPLGYSPRREAREVS